MKSLSQYLLEATAEPRIPHPEDSIFEGSDRAKSFVQALKDIANNPEQISIKWDGGIALIFGIDPDKRFYINDKYMPDAFFAHSPEDWAKYDTEIKKSRTARPDLYDKLAGFWNGLRDLVTKAPGTYKGDLMFAHELNPQAGNFVFKPVTVEYHIPVASSLGKLIQGRQALIVAHLLNGSPWQGKPMTNNIVSVIPSNMGVQFNVQAPTNLIVQAESAISKFGNLADQFRLGMPKTYSRLLQQYLNQTITQTTTDNLTDWITKNLKPGQIKFLLGDNGQGYLYENRAGLDGLFAIWNAIYALKSNLAQQLESQVTGMKQFVNGRPQGEGFVFQSRLGLVKLVQRHVFGQAHFSGFNQTKK